MSGIVTEISELAKGSPERFGYSWDRYADLLPEHEEQFLRWTALDKSFWQRRSFSWTAVAALAATATGRWSMARGAD